MRKARLTLAFLCLCGAAGAAEPATGVRFPGQLELAAGLVCYQNLDLACARTRLEAALTRLSPEEDPDFLAHLQEVRFTLAELHTAEDDLARAEQQFIDLLLVCPDYRLPEGDHPPKLRYVFEQASEQLARRAAAPPAPTPEADPGAPSRAERPPVVAEPPRVEVKPTPAEVRPPPIEVEPPGALPAPADELRAFRLALLGRAVVVFGEDAEAVNTGAGADLRFAWTRPLDRDLRLGVDLTYAYAYHGNRQGADALQSMSLAAAVLLALPVGPLDLRLGLGLGAHTMGTRDRYDHWLALLQLRAGLVWPRDGVWGLTLEAQPSLLISSAESSFFLPLGLGLEVRW